MTELNRRTVTKGIAWSVPAVAAATAAPAFAASPVTPPPTTSTPLPDPVRIPTDGWTFTASSSTDLSGNNRGGRPQHAFDGDTETFWHSQWNPSHVEPPHSITAEAPEAKSFREVRYLLRSDMERPRTLYVQTSNDGTSWTTVAIQPYENGAAAGPTWNTVAFAPVTATHIRLATADDGTYEVSKGHFVVREIQFWG